MRSLAFTVAAWSALASAALGATDGVLGPTSTGSLEVTATVTAASTATVRVSGASDLVLPVIDAANDASTTVAERSARTSICFFHTSPTFSLQFRQAVSGFDFLMTGPGDPIPFAMGFEGLEPFSRATGGFGGNGASFTGLISNRQNETCATGPRATVDAFRSRPVPATQRNGVYRATVSIIMAVE